jgi:hypothetical protein
MQMRRMVIGALAVLGGVAVTSAGGARPQPYGGPTASLRQQVIWGAECREPEGTGLAFGGEDQRADDGRPHTRLLVNGQWAPIHQELRKANPLQTYRDRAWAVRTDLKNALARARYFFFEGLPAVEEAKRLAAEVTPKSEQAAKDLATLIADLEKVAPADDYAKGQIAFAVSHLKTVQGTVKPLTAPISAEALASARQAQVQMEIGAEALDAEPPPRAVSPVVYDAKTGLYVVFGGDHLDYLTCDTWVFDAAKRRWSQRHPSAAPPPRANHTLAVKEGVVTLTGGYRYFNNTDYMGGQYVDIGDGPWRYDIEKDAWTGQGKPVAADTREYRTHPFLPETYMQGVRPSAAEFQATLDALPVNEWAATNPPHRLQMQRDWGRCIIDPDRDVILFWSGGHCAHGGSDVPAYHLSANRWELPFPVEFPLGLLYSNTSYPAGFNFNLRPWMTGHSYQNYGYDPRSKMMVQTGHPRDFFIYDPTIADWIGRGPKPRGMDGGDCFYDNAIVATPKGAICWTKDGSLFQYDGAARAWTQLKTGGAKLRGSSTDNSTLTYDSKRDRILFVGRAYGGKFDGLVYAYDLKTSTVQVLTPEGAAGAVRIAGLDRGCYDARNDLFILGTYLTGAAVDERPRVPAYDCAANRWVALDIKFKVQRRGDRTTYEFPYGHSSGTVFDPKRNLLWGADTYGRVYVLRLDAASADAQALPVP